MLKVLSREQRVLLPITNSGYGVGEAGKFCTEETPLRPISLYGATRSRPRRAVLERGTRSASGSPPCSACAPRMRIDLLVNDFVYRAVNDRFVVLFEGHFKRNYIHIRDVARAFEHAHRELRSHARPGLQCRPVGRQPVQARAVRAHPASTCRDFVFLEAPIGEDPDKRDYIVSNEKIERTGFAPAHSLDAGIAELIKGYTMLRDSVFHNL